ncbi:hypothetical protein HYX14_00585 [Candidatus Woesearchaeota archaeon]|nr:hypothetical protein [Candidatus Woesearchaeota archaeon]
MSSSEFVQRARKIIRENPEMFSALEEYDRTRKLPKLSYKIRANFTLDAEILRQFRSYCKNRGMNMSRVLENHIREELKRK